MENIKITKSRRKSISIHIKSNGIVEVKAPRLVPNFLIDQFIKSKKDWIEKSLQKVNKNQRVTLKFVDGEKFMFLGKEYNLKIGNYIHIEIKDNNLLFPTALAKNGKYILEKWYIKQAKRIITPLVEEYSHKMGTTYNAITFSDTKSQWGRCTHDNRLQFNWRLVMAPLLVLRYVVIHELSHTTEKNHSAIFWNKVRTENPSYRQQIKWLKENNNLLHY